VPIVRINGKWSFDASRPGRDARTAHRLDELDAIEICYGYVEAQMNYATEDRDKGGMLKYAPRLMSTPGHHDGLYWKERASRWFPRLSPGQHGTAYGRAGKAVPRYYFRVLDGQDPMRLGTHNYLLKTSDWRFAW